jgi:5-methylcytosine-specific restriction enzyme A
MPVKPRSRCRNCKQLHTGTGMCNRCRLADRRARRPDMRTDENRRAQVVAAWRADQGDVCPGWQCPPHPAADLTADHIQSVAAGGREDGELTVLCVPCNSRKRDSQ